MCRWVHPVWRRWHPWRSRPGWTPSISSCNWLTSWTTKYRPFQLMCLSVWARAHRFPTASSCHWPSSAVARQELLWRALWVSLALKALLGQSLHPLTFQRTWWIEHAYDLFMAWSKLLRFHRCDAYTYSTGIIFNKCNVEKVIVSIRFEWACDLHGKPLGHTDLFKNVG